MNDENIALQIASILLRWFLLVDKLKNIFNFRVQNSPEKTTLNSKPLNIKYSHTSTNFSKYMKYGLSKNQTKLI